MIEPLEFAKIMAMLAAMFPRSQQVKEPATIDAYYAILSDLPIDLLKAAVLEWGRKDTPWPPSAGQLRSLAFTLIEHCEGQVTAAEAWQEAREVLRYGLGVISADDFSDPVIYEAVQAIGARDIFRMQEQAIVSTRARFMTAFDTLLDRRRTSQQMLPVVRETMARLSGDNAVLLEEGDGPRTNI